MKPTAFFATTVSALTSSLAFSQLPAPDTVSNPENKEGTTKMRHLISMPKTAVDFIKNIKYSFDNNLLLNDKFFDKNNICSVFSIVEKSCDPAKTNKPDGTREISLYSGEFTGIFPAEQNSIQPNSTQRRYPTLGASIVTAQISIYKKIDSRGIIKGGINFVTREGGPSFDETTKILNTDLFQVIEMSPHGKIPLPITGAHGDETWRYETFDGNFKKILTVGFEENGNLGSILVQIEEIEGGQ